MMGMHMGDFNDNSPEWMDYDEKGGSADEILYRTFDKNKTLQTLKDKNEKIVTIKDKDD